MTFAKCGIPYIGLATNGIPYCHRCINWKTELQVHRDAKPKNAKGWPK